MDMVTTAEAPQLDSDVLPWWRSKANLGVIAVAIALLAGALGWVIGNNRALPDPNSTDIGFLQDMRTHHDQAVFISLIYLAVPEASSNLQLIARDIVVSQNVEIGRMVQLLRQFGASESNETETAMTWMNEPTPSDRMPGLATETDLKKLSASKGAEADQLFAALMIAHHEGGIHMAQFAAEHADVAEVRRFASAMVIGQQSEIDEMRALIAG
jgi:uncharacterized protein (DUF305 family)